MAMPSPHVVLFPFLGRGHIPAFLRLADILHCHCPNISVTIVSTPRHIDFIRSSLPASSPLSFHALNFSFVDRGLPPHVESIADISVHQFIDFFEASESLRLPFDNFISTIATSHAHAPLCIVSDFFFSWTADVSKKYNAFSAILFPGGAFGMAVFFASWVHLPHNCMPSDLFPVPDYPEVVLHRTQLPRYMLSATGSDQWTLFFRRIISFFHKTNALLVNTVEEVESLGLDLLKRSYHVPIFPVGPLLDAPKPSSSLETENIVKWLDSQATGTVLYISFGSHGTIQAKQMMELAMGLEVSGRPFIWVIRPPLGFDIKGEFKPEWLPERFEERMKNKSKGLLIHGWAPQVKILAHSSTGAFLSHCGWNSILESLSYGVPIIGWAIGAEQFFNAKLLVELGVCLEVARGNLDSSVVGKATVEEVVETVMGATENGRETRKKAKVIKGFLEKAWSGEGGGSSARSFNEFLGAAGMAGQKSLGS